MKRYFRPIPIAMLATVALLAWAALALPTAAPIGALPLIWTSANPRPASGAPLSELWHKRMSGYVSDIAISDDGNAVLVATLPNFDRAGGAKQNFLYYFDGSGRQIWHRDMPVQVKSMAISGDGRVAIATTHDDQINAYSSSGRVLWSVDGTCKPITFKRGDQFLCYHDDDAEPRVAFDVFSLSTGKRIYSYPSKDDILAFGLSDDEKNFAIGLTGGKVILFSADHQALWQTFVPGEIVDLAVSYRASERSSDLADASPRVAVLYSPKASPRGKTPQKIAVFGNGGARLAQGALAVHSDQIEWMPDTASFLAYGNDEDGQVLSLYSISGAAVREQWLRQDPESANYTPTLFVMPPQILVGAESDRNDVRWSGILAFNADGSPGWSLPVYSSEAAYLYTQSLAPEARLLAVAMDDGYFALYRFNDDHAAAGSRSNGRKAPSTPN